MSQTQSITGEQSSDDFPVHITFFEDGSVEVCAPNAEIFDSVEEARSYVEEFVLSDEEKKRLSEDYRAEEEELWWDKLAREVLDPDSADGSWRSGGA